MLPRKPIPIDKKIITRLFDQIKSTEIDSRIYHDILCDLILNKQSGPFPNPIISDAVTEINHYQKCHPSINKMIYKELHTSWKETHQSIPREPNEFRNIPEMLSWGWEIKMSGQKSIKLDSCDLVRFEFLHLIALWEAIKTSQVETILNIEDLGKSFLYQSRDACQVSCKGIAESRLKSFELFHPQHSSFSTDLWAMFWEAIKQSQIEDIDLSYTSLLTQGSSIHPHWNIMCDGLIGSKVKSLNLGYNNLCLLNRDDWIKFRLSIVEIKLRSLDLSSTNMYSQREDGTFDAFCDVIRAGYLKKLIIRGETFEHTRLEELLSFCQALGSSSLEELDICISQHNNLPDYKWKIFIAEIGKKNLKSLILNHYSTTELSHDIINALSDMLASSSLESLVVHPRLNYGMVISLSDWKKLSSAFKIRGIKEFNFGSMPWASDNFLGFTEGILTSGVTALHLQHCNLNWLSVDTWHQFSQLILNANIKILDLRNCYYDSKNLYTKNSPSWKALCDFIVTSKIKTFYFDITYDHAFFHEQPNPFCDAIKNSQLETLSLNFRYLIVQLSHRHLKLLFDAINQSNIMHLPCLNEASSVVRGDKLETVTNTLRIVNHRAHYKNTLYGLCASTLFRQYHAVLTENSITYGTDKATWKKDLAKSEVERLKQFI